MRGIESDPHSVSDYLRTTDFESGEVKVTWRDNQGVWVRRTFVSRPDNAVVQLLTAPDQGAINGTLQLDTSMVLPGRRTNGAGTRITERAANPGRSTSRALIGFDFFAPSTHIISFYRATIPPLRAIPVTPASHGSSPSGEQSSQIKMS